MSITKSALVCYLLAVHIVLGLAFWKSNFLFLINRKLDVNKSEISDFHYDLLRYQKIQDESMPEEVAIFIGDSLIQGLVTFSVVDKSVNFGIGGDTSFAVLQRIDEYQSIHTAKSIVMMIGINDLVRGRKESDLIKNVELILKKMGDVPVYLSAVLPVDEQAGPWSGLNKKIDSVNQQFMNLSENLQNVRFLNSNSVLRGNSGYLLASAHVGDGIHLSPKGYALWVEFLKQNIR